MLISMLCYVCFVFKSFNPFISVAKDNSEIIVVCGLHNNAASSMKHQVLVS